MAEFRSSKMQVQFEISLYMSHNFEHLKTQFYHLP